MLHLLKHEVPNYFVNMEDIYIYNHLTNQRYLLIPGKQSGTNCQKCQRHHGKNDDFQADIH